MRTAGAVGLVALLALPALGAAVVAALPARADRAARLTGTAVAALVLVLSVALLPVGGGPAHQGTPAAGAPAIQPWHEVDLNWVPGLALRFHLGIDGLSYPLVVLTALLTLLCCGYTVFHVPTRGAQSGAGVGRPDRGRGLVALLLVIEVGILGTFLALDLVLFFLFFEVVLLPMYAVIAGWGGADTSPSTGTAPHQAAARKFALYTLLGSVLLMVGVLAVVTTAGTADIVLLTGGTGLSRNTQYVAFALLAFAFAVKSPLWPLHTWLPDAHTQAPTVGSVILAGVLLKMGTYGLIRVAVGVAPDGARAAAPVLGVLAVAAILIGSLVCLAQRELKRLIAYSSVSHMGFVLLGIATLTATGLQAAMIGNIAHGVLTGLLFFLVGAVKDRTHTGLLAELGGLREATPRLAGLLGFAAIGSLGLPGLAGFWGEALAVVAAFEVGGGSWATLGVLAAFGGALTAAYFLRLLRRVTHGPATPAVAALASQGPAAGRIAPAELVAWGPLVLLALALGLVPALVLDLTGDPVRALLEALR